MFEMTTLQGNTVTLSLVSHTNVGKTTLARTLLGRDIGEVRDAPHVTEWAAMFPLASTAEGEQLRLWDTPGFGDSARLLRRMQQSGSPVGWLGWLLSQVWDRWRDRAFWASQQALRHVQEQSDVVLYLVNAAESPAGAGYVAPEMDLLAWLGKPVLVLLNQLGAPRAAADEAAEVELWRAHLSRWPQVKQVLPMDAFARCWVHEATLLQAVQQVLDAQSAARMQRLTAAWLATREAVFAQAMQVLAQGLARAALAKEVVRADAQWGERLRRLGAALGKADEGGTQESAQDRLAKQLAEDSRLGTEQLLRLHQLDGQAQMEIMQRVQGQFTQRARISEGRAALWGGAVTGAVAGLKADILSGGLTMGGGLLAGGLLGALGAAGVARGVNVVRGVDHSWVAFSDDALLGAAQAALLRYLAVAHFGRGRGQWAQGEAPPHWGPAVAQALAARKEAITAVWRDRGTAPSPSPSPSQSQSQSQSQANDLATRLQPLLRAATHEVLHQLYPGAPVATIGGDTAA
jgi:Domain of unknown function (DUF3482)/50S ribosome-binding GTPase